MKCDKIYFVCVVCSSARVFVATKQFATFGTTPLTVLVHLASLGTPFKAATEFVSTST